MFEKWILGCQDTHWSQFEPQLHSYVTQQLLGRFSTDLAHVSSEEIHAHAERIFADSQRARCAEALRETLNQARDQGRGVTGLRRVLHALELGEVQTLLVGDHYHCAGRRVHPAAAISTPTSSASAQSAAAKLAR